ncbi:TPR-like protein [Sanghuangporus baumii]|uniref:TPR-like protein n=1 Tax=Sanghuangporus baumii TaxID=108892 RepID=A0A9Q5I5D7_SANBA|nr:TPR-like protein [Sanghuangporus baumii]
MLMQVRRLSQEQEEILEEVRRIPGFEDLLQASPFEVLLQADTEGPVIVINHSEHRCDALIVLSGKEVSFVCVPGQGRRVSSAEYDEVLRLVMKVSWDRVASEVVQKPKELGIHEGLCIWWCPTSVLSALPFHAAGPYEGADGTEKYLLDDYISSYTPALKSLITARSKSMTEVGGRIFFVADTRLPSAKKERDTVRRVRRIDKQLLDDPGDSGSSTKDASEACHTAEQHPKVAMDEVLRLSSAMQFCGFRSVIGTMWQLLDRDGPFLTLVIYTYLIAELGEGEVRFKKAAAAVRDAALRLKERGD